MRKTIILTLTATALIAGTLAEARPSDRLRERIGTNRERIETRAATVAELVPTLELIKQAVEAGELDAQIEAAAVKLRTGFTK